MADANTWEQAGGRPITVSVNLSAVQFVQPISPSDPARPAEIGLPTSASNSRSPDPSPWSTRRWRSPRSSGCMPWAHKLSIDDFGTGTRRWRTQRFRIDKLKIDKSLCGTSAATPVTGDRHRRHPGAKALRCVTIAEGVGNLEQQEFLRSRGAI
jgi:EAL domain-containing protein (putative c-di-GMP-specific phosphodiesterase class I)